MGVSSASLPGHRFPKLSLDVDLGALRVVRTLDPRTREDVFYAYGRATMVLDLGHREAAERALERLEELRNTYAGEAP